MRRPNLPLLHSEVSLSKQRRPLYVQETNWLSQADWKATFSHHSLGLAGYEKRRNQPEESEKQPGHNRVFPLPCLAKQ